MELLGFVLGEIFLLALVAWIFIQLRGRGVLPHEPGRRNVIAFLMFLVPLALGALTLPGVLWRIKETGGTPIVRNQPTAGVILPATGGTATSTATDSSTISPNQAGDIPSVTQDQDRETESTAEPTLSTIATISPDQISATPHGMPATAASTPSNTPTLPAPTLTPTPTNAQATGTVTLTQATITNTLTGKIVYVCQVHRDTDRDQICLMNADGSEQRQLTQNEAADYNYPSFSPNGSHTIYVGKEESFFEIFETNLETGETKQLTEFSAARTGDALAPEISPDGRKILYALHANGYNSLWVMNRDGSDAQMIFGPPKGYGWDPVWSPDGREILFASYQGGLIQLFIASADGSNHRQVTDIPGIRGRNDWSPDGLTIATYVGESWRREIYLMNLDGSNARPITAGGNNLAPGFSPDGQWIVFTSYRDKFADENGCEIYVMRRDGTEVIRLTENDYCDWQPRWGP